MSTPFSLHLAPLHSVTNKTFRTAYFHHFGGFEGVLAPFILCVNTREVKPSHFKDILPPTNCPNLIPQILGNDHAAFSATALILRDMGYSEINWNLGCPYPMVAKKQRGSGLLPYPERIAGILDHLCALPGITVSIKMRLGRNNPAESLVLMPIFNRYPLSRIIIHPRIGTQMYRGSVDLEGFRHTSKLSEHPITYNGDITDVSGFTQLRTQFPSITDWMIGRGVLRDPLLAERLSGAFTGSRQEAVIKIEAFHDELYRSYQSVLFGSAHVLDKMKEIWSYLGTSFPESRILLESIPRIRCLPEYEKATSSIFHAVLQD